MNSNTFSTNMYVQTHTLSSINISPNDSQWLELGFQSYYEKFGTNVEVID
jgi:hypothetical protein